MKFSILLLFAMADARERGQTLIFIGISLKA